MIDKFNLIVCGVGGQGVLTLSRILASAAVKFGYNVSVGETLGMSQRGGIVQSFIRIGGGVLSPLIPSHSVHTVISLDYIESLRVIKYVSKDSSVILNSNTITPSSVLLGEFGMPTIDDVKKVFKGLVDNLYIIDADELASKVNLPTASNIVMLGLFIKLHPNILSLDIVKESIRENVPSKYLHENLLAFNLGYNLQVKR